MLADYPTPLRESMLEHLHTLLRKTLPNDPTGLKLRARRLLPEDVEDVEKLGVGNEELLIQAREQGGAVSAAYAEVIQEWCQRDLEPSLVGDFVIISLLRSNQEGTATVPDRLSAVADGLQAPCTECVGHTCTITEQRRGDARRGGGQGAEIHGGSGSSRRGCLAGAAGGRATCRDDGRGNDKNLGDGAENGKERRARGGTDLAMGTGRGK